MPVRCWAEAIFERMYVVGVPGPSQRKTGQERWLLPVWARALHRALAQPAVKASSAWGARVCCRQSLQTPSTVCSLLLQQ
eukprot:158358-Pleurochrysis_carterae.AAC.3